MALDFYGQLTRDLENLSYFNLNQLQNRYLGTIFNYANLASTCWDGASAVGALMIKCQNLTSENTAKLKAKGVIFDDAPGDSLYTYLPFSPRSPVPN